LSKKLTVQVDAVSKSARSKIEGAGGSVEIVSGNPRQKRAQAIRQEVATEAAAEG
jgi:ribosomal protein L18E